MQELPLTILGERPVEKPVTNSSEAENTAVDHPSPPLHLQPQTFPLEVVHNHLNLDHNDASAAEEVEIGDHGVNSTIDQVPVVQHAPTAEQPALNVLSLASASLGLDRAKDERQGDSTMVPPPREAIEISRPEFNLPSKGQQQQQRVVDDSFHVRGNPHPLLGTALRRVSFHGFLPRSNASDPDVGRLETAKTRTDIPQRLPRLTRTPSPPSASVIKPYTTPPVRRSYSHPMDWSDMEEGNGRGSLVSLNQTNVIGAPPSVGHLARTYSPGLVPPSPKLKGGKYGAPSRPNDPPLSVLSANSNTATTTSATTAASHFLERFTSAKFF
ncbi:hypothetical protein IWQ61_010686 [Dispira simplex]|nr:hypothetical protein IWQ61_010686 [Dispira simplex]